MHLRWNRVIFVSILLIIMLSAGFLFAYTQVNDLALGFCFRNLEQAAAQTVKEINSQLSGDQQQLNVIAEVIEEFAAVDSRETRMVLSSYEGSGMINRLEILLPDNRIIFSDKSTLNAEGTVSFQKESLKGAYISGLQPDFRNMDKRVIRHCIPITQGEETIALLYGVVELEKFPALFLTDIYDGQAQIYIIEGQSGDFILDTWHETLGNVSELTDRKAKDGYSVERVNSDRRTGRAGNTVFLSQSTGEYFYSYYEPIGINDWMLLLTIEESVVFEDANRIRSIFLQFAVYEAVLFILYLVWVFLRAKKERFEKEEQLGRVQYMLSVEKMLFDAHREPQHIEKALEKIGEALQSGTVFFLMLEDKKIKQSYVWSEKAWENRSALEGMDLLPYIDECMQTQKSVVIQNLKEISAKYPEEYAVMKRLGIQNLMFTFVGHMDNAPAGLLGAVNTRHRWETAEQLECVAVSFAMAINNIEGYDTIHKMGAIDYLTGLLNRNSFYDAVNRYDDGSARSIACVYVDVNGLHELNNHLGHTEGDHMLQFVASVLKRRFGKRNVYRIGGDEFLAVCVDEPEEEIRQTIARVEDDVSAGGYRVSIGMEWRSDQTPVCLVLKKAESKMREAKRQYYETKGDRENAREYNQRLEQIIVKKKDSDTFLSIIASDFFGVYTVNLNTDEVRYIFIPPYFQTILDKAGGRFKTALEEYILQMVAPSDHEKFATFLDYKLLAQRLEQEEAPEVRYLKIDGMKLILRVFKSQDYSEQNKETVWIFEK